MRGDAIVAGRQIILNGTVDGDLVAAGQTLTINGTVSDDVRVAGQVLTLGEKARVADDVVAGGFSLESKAGSTVGGDLSFGGAQALLAGTVEQDVTAGMNALELRGSVGRDVNVEIGGDESAFSRWMPTSSTTIPAVQPGLTVTDSARIGGTLISRQLLIVRFYRQLLRTNYTNYSLDTRSRKAAIL